ncbi:FAD-dependent oxidoreductase [Streptomyces sp. G-G2]|uniref:FAD-dependent oxidoreductase n=1 Tax=Streptomyces sp. G-G2 TaxID=3046201 RepID=UPI0024B8AD1D|nr:FAD-dependent oxidoreductase [Streptomyces sp. G-G2]MDJ0382184.1 FAD-dependent monooxygenase [Streptomyces sp. G-G2]
MTATRRTPAADRVLVAGAGPVGLTAALVLARRGVPVTVLEAGAELATESRASTFHPPTLEMLAELGVVDALLARGLIAGSFQFRDRRTGPVATLDLSLLSEDTPYPFRLQCEQNKLTPLLVDALGRFPDSEVRFGARVAEVERTSRGVCAVLSDGSRVLGSWLVGADGAHSAVRRSVGAEFHGITYPERFLVASLDENPGAVLPDLAPIAYVLDPDEWMVLLQTPDHWRVLLPTPAGTSDRSELARLPGRLLDITAHPGGPALAHASLYRVHQRVAGTFRSGRVLLCGDAAHVNNPLGGMGMNSGIHDAVLMGRALADLLTGAGSDEELSDCAEERRACALRYVGAETHGNWERLRTRDPEERAALAAELRATAADPAAARRSLLRSSMIDSLRGVRWSR